MLKSHWHNKLKDKFYVSPMWMTQWSFFSTLASPSETCMLKLSTLEMRQQKDHMGTFKARPLSGHSCLNSSACTQSHPDFKRKAKRYLETCWAITAFTTKFYNDIELHPCSDKADI